MMFDGHLLSVLIWLPIVGGFAVLAFNDRIAAAKWLSLFVSGLSLLLSVPLYAAFKTGTAAMQFVERAPWISTIHAEYYIGVDGISMPLILLTTFTTVLIVIASWTNVAKRVAQYFAAFLILEGLMIGVFAALDAALFYVFWEAMLIPDVHHHRRVGRPAAGLRHHQVLPVHLHRLAADAGCADLHVPEIGQLRARRVPAHAADAQRTDLHFPGLLRGIRGEGADVAGAHLVARCAR